MPIHETDVCIIGGGITSAMLAQKLSELRRGLRITVVEADIAAMRDAGARDNYRIWLRFRERLLAATTLESAYVELFRGDGVDVPPQFVAQLALLGQAQRVFGESTHDDAFLASSAWILPSRRWT